ncbi:MAG: spermine synthase [Gammaproteobacteria bacterium]|nr:spermine synthase [Gammaproteobacteria bacterium]
MPSPPWCGSILSDARARTYFVTTRLTARWAWVLVLLYGFSGLTALAYQVLWARMLSLQFGVSIFGVIVTVAAFMAGLGAGSLAGAALSRRVRAPLLWFAALEGAVALFALLSPYIFRVLDARLDGFAADVSLNAWYLTQGAATLLLLLIPATALGVTFPLMLRALSASRLGVAELYGVNTLGAVIGALLPLVLLPALGWISAMRSVAGLGLAMALSAALLATFSWGRIKPGLHHVTVRPGLKHLIAYGVVGAAALMLEIAWTRLFGMTLLRTEYVMALILAIFLFGIGVGSLAARTLLRRDALFPTLFTALPLAAAGFAVLSLWFVPRLSAWGSQGAFNSLPHALTLQGLALAALTLPVTLMLGAWLPLLSKRLGAYDGDGVVSRSRRPASRDISTSMYVSGAALYGANSLGAALGALTAGTILMPLLGAPATVCIAALLLLLCGAVWITPRYTHVAAWGVGGLLIVLAAWPVRDLPPVARLLPEAQAYSTDIFRHEDALAITHVIERADGQRVLLTDLQRMDAASDQAAVAVQENQARLPLLLHPAPHSVLFLGLGTGISAAGSLPYPDLERTAVELSQGAIDAARDWFAPVNGGVLTAIHVTRDDARRFLRATAAYYDVIIGDLFHPDLAGHSALLSVQQFERARARLAPGGLFVQWLALNQFDPASLDVVLESFRHAFPGAVLFVDGLHLALVGPQHHFSGAPDVLANLNRLTADVQNRATGGEGPWTWLGRYWGAITPRVAPLQEEWAPRIEFRLPRARYGGATHLVALLDRMLAQRPSLEQAARELQVAEADRPAFERAYGATELALRGWRMSLQGEGEDARLLRLAYEANPRDRWIGFALADAMFATLPQAVQQGTGEREALQRVLAVRPDHAEALRALWHLERTAGHAGEAERLRARLKAAAPLDRELRAGP